MEINMAIDKVREYFKTYQMDDHLLEFDVSSSTNINSNCWRYKNR